MSTDDASKKIDEWCATHAPRTYAKLGPAAPAFEIRRVSDQLRLTSAESAFFLHSWHDGSVSDGQGDGADLWPDWTLSRLDEVLDTTRDQRDVAADLFNRTEIESNDNFPAGTPSPMWLPSFVAIGKDMSGNQIAIDMRAGSIRGQVFSFDEDGTGRQIATALSVFVAKLYDSLAQNKSFGSHRWDVRNGELFWTTGDSFSKRRIEHLQSVVPRQHSSGFAANLDAVSNAVAARKAALWEGTEEVLNDEGDYRLSAELALLQLAGTLIQDPPELWPASALDSLETYAADLGEILDVSSGDELRDRRQQLLTLITQTRRLIVQGSDEAAG